MLFFNSLFLEFLSHSPHWSFRAHKNLLQFKGVFWRDILKVAKNFLGSEMPLSVFWQRLNFGETLSEEEEKVLG